MQARTLTRTILAAVAGTVALTGAATASWPPADCKLVVKGKTYISGICEFSKTDEDGSFQINGGDWFAVVNLEGKGKAEASWNAEPDNTHAHSSLGTVKRKGVCWVGRGVEICARDLSPAELAEVRATRPDGDLINVDRPGYTSSCIGASDQRWEPGAALVLRVCKLPGDRIFVRSGGALALDKHADLCIDAQPGPAGKPARLVLAACDRAPKRWEAAAGDSTAIRSADGLCWAVDQIEDEDSEFPLAMIAVPCGDAAKAEKFVFQKE